ncbi:MAG: polysaccharide biosynthesis tyrosine autokinase [Acidobacteriota bacterium]|nr:polysaccharide biosynthesis tyrosine autokinase [Acidobacteriota bacterium]
MTGDDRIRLFDQAPRPEHYGEPLPIAPVEAAPDLRAYGRILWKRRWTVFSALVVTLTATLIYTVKQKPLYRAHAMLEVEQENPNIVTVERLFQLQSVSPDYLETQYKILRSDTLARQVIEEDHLDRTKEFNPPTRAWPWRVSAESSQSAARGSSANSAVEQRVLRAFENRLSVDPVRRSLLVQVSFDSENPERAARVVNTLTTAYIQENLRTHFEATKQASAWLSKQLDQLKIKLENSQDALQRYAEANGLLFLESNTGQTENIVNERLQQLQGELTKAQADLYQKESLYRLIQSGDTGALPGVFDNKMMQQLTVQLADLERQQAQLAPNFKPGYPRMREIQSQIDRIQQVLEQQRAQAARHIEDEYLAAARRTALLRGAFDAQQRQANLVAEKSVQYNILKREVETNKQLYQGLLEQLKQAGISSGLKASNIRVVDPAVPPARPDSPRIMLNLAFGFLLGLGGGVGLAFLQDHLDNTLKNQSDIETFLRVPALAVIPSHRSLLPEKANHRQWMQKALVAPGRNHGAARRATASGWLRVDSESLQQSALAEAFRSLRTSVLLSAATRPPRSLVIISAEPAEGKTTICGNLAISLAQLGKRVLVVDADLRRPCLHAFFHLRESAGLVDYLTGDCRWDGLVQYAGIRNLACLVSGPLPPNPSELLSSERMKAFLREAAAEYEFVLIDSPPLLNLADGRILGTMVEGAILVAKGGATPRELVQRAQFCLSDVGARVLGVVLNDVDLPRDENYAHYHHYRAAQGEGARG